MSKLQVYFEETQSLISELRSNLNELNDSEIILQSCIDKITEQTSPKKVNKIYEEIKSLKKALENFKDDNIAKTIDIIEEGCNEFSDVDIDTSNVIKESYEMGN